MERSRTKELLSTTSGLNEGRIGNLGIKMVSFQGSAMPLVLAVFALGTSVCAHPNSGLPPPKFDQHGHNHGSMYGMMKGVNRENPVLQPSIRTDHTSEEIEAALAYHAKVAARFAAGLEDPADPLGEGDVGEEEEEGTAPGSATDSDMLDMQYANADQNGNKSMDADKPYPFQIEGNSPPGAGDVGKETVSQASAPTVDDEQ